MAMYVIMLDTGKFLVELPFAYKYGGVMEATRYLTKAQAKKVSKTLGTKSQWIKSKIVEVDYGNR